MKKLTLFFIALLFGSVTIAQNYSEIKTSELPKKATAWIKKNLPDGKLGRAGKMDISGTLKYAIVISSRDRKSIFVFDKNGNYLDRVSKIEDIPGVDKANLKPAPPATKPPAKTNPNTDPPQKK